MNDGTARLVLHYMLLLTSGPPNQPPSQTTPPSPSDVCNKHGVPIVLEGYAQQVFKCDSPVGSSVRVSFIASALTPNSNYTVALVDSNNQSLCSDLEDCRLALSTSETVQDRVLNFTLSTQNATLQDANVLIKSTSNSSVSGNLTLIWKMNVLATAAYCGRKLCQCGVDGAQDDCSCKTCGAQQQQVPVGSSQQQAPIAVFACVPIGIVVLAFVVSLVRYKYIRYNTIMRVEVLEPVPHPDFLHPNKDPPKPPLIVKDPSGAPYLAFSHRTEDLEKSQLSDADTVTVRELSTREPINGIVGVEVVKDERSFLKGRVMQLQPYLVCVDYYVADLKEDDADIEPVRDRSIYSPLSHQVFLEDIPSLPGSPSASSHTIDPRRFHEP